MSDRDPGKATPLLLLSGEVLTTIAREKADVMTSCSVSAKRSSSGSRSQMRRRLPLMRFQTKTLGGQIASLVLLSAKTANLFPSGEKIGAELTVFQPWGSLSRSAAGDFGSPPPHPPKASSTKLAAVGVNAFEEPPVFIRRLLVA
jgi:hypothetical protein